MPVTHPEARKAWTQERRLLWGWWLLLPVQAVLVAWAGLPLKTGGWQLQLINLATGGLCAFGLSRDARPFSLNQVYWVFTFVFMALMPALFYSRGFMPHGPLPEHLMLKASMLVLGSSVLYTATQMALSVRFRKEKTHDEGFAPGAAGQTYFRQRAPWLMAICALAVVLILGPANLWLQFYTEQAWEAHITDNTLRLLARYSLRGTMLYLCMAAIFWYRQGKLSGGLLFAFLALAVLANFPLSMSRYLAGTFYLAILLWWLPPGMVKPPRFAFTLMALILLAAPLLNAARMQQFVLKPGEQRDFPFLLRTSYSGDYDAYAMLCRSIQYTDSLGTTSGRQLAGALLFFVPRSAWPDKPVGSGSKVYQELGLGTDDWSNVSCPLPGEGYVNFGIAGTLIFVVFLGAFIFFYDRHFWQWRRRRNAPVTYQILFYPVMLGLLLLWLRGDMMSAFAYSAGLFVSGAFIHQIMKARLRNSIT